MINSRRHKEYTHGGWPLLKHLIKTSYPQHGPYTVLLEMLQLKYFMRESTILFLYCVKIRRFFIPIKKSVQLCRRQHTLQDNMEFKLIQFPCSYNCDSFSKAAVCFSSFLRQWSSLIAYISSENATSNKPVFELIDFTHDTSAPQRSARLHKASEKSLFSFLQWKSSKGEGTDKERKLEEGSEEMICRDGGWGRMQEVYARACTSTDSHMHTGAYMTSHYLVSPREDRSVARHS